MHKDMHPVLLIFIQNHRSKSASDLTLDFLRHYDLILRTTTVGERKGVNSPEDHMLYIPGVNNESLTALVRRT